MVKIIFLDIDGVLNTGRYQKWLREKNRPNRDEFGMLFCPMTIAHLEKLVYKTEAKVVISSMWRLSGFEVMKDLFKVRGIDVDVIGITRFIESGGFLHQAKIRGDEIREWLIENDHVEKYVILDDNTDFLPEQIPYFIRTDPRVGFTKECLEKALKILNDGAKVSW